MTQPGGLPSIDVQDAARRLADGGDEKPILVDVRNPDEFAAARVEGAVLIPLPEFATRFAELPTDRALLVICHVGGRSAAATAHLLRNGYVDATNVTGGMDAWLRAGLPARTGPPEPGEGDLP
jgi:rhodanese-related sulfurtransferase